MRTNRLVAATAAVALGAGAALVGVSAAQAEDFGPSTATLGCAVYFDSAPNDALFPSEYTDTFELTVDPDVASSGQVDVQLKAAEGVLNTGPSSVQPGGTIDVELVLDGGQTGTVTLTEDAPHPAALVPGSAPGEEGHRMGAWSASGSFTATSDQLTTVRVRTITFNIVGTVGALSVPTQTVCSNEGNQDPKAEAGLTTIQAAINGEGGTPTATGPTGGSTPTTTGTPPTTSTPSPSSTGGAVDTSPREKSANLDVSCKFFQFPLGDFTATWPTTIRVTPGAAAPGSTVKVEVILDGSPPNGPTPLEAGAMRFEAAIKFNGQDVQLIGPLSPAAAVNAPAVFTDLPLVASGTVTLPDTEGDYPIELTDLWFNSPLEGGSYDSLQDMFDMRCNAGADPFASPKSLALTVDVSSDADAPAANETVAPPPGDAGPGGGELPGPGGDDGDELGGSGTDRLADTGPNEALIVGLLALLALQVGLVLTVRAVRARPAARHL